MNTISHLLLSNKLLRIKKSKMIITIMLGALAFSIQTTFAGPYSIKFNDEIC
jgi:hypothetical protein